MPIYADRWTQPLGVFEIYKRPRHPLRDMPDARMMVLAVALGGGLLLYISLFAIVRQAAQTD